MSETTPSEGNKKERPYGIAPIALLAWLATMNLYYNLEYIPKLYRSFNIQIDLSIYQAAWLIILALQYAFAYGLWKPKKWAGDVGIISLALGTFVSVGMVLASIALSMPVALHFYPAAWSISAFYGGWRFLKRPEVRDYIESEGHPKTTPLRLVDQEIPDSIRGKRPESVAWIAEDRSVGEIFLDKDHLTIVRSPKGPVAQIPIQDIVELEPGELRPDNPFDIADGRGMLKAMGLSQLATIKVSKLRITYSTKSGQMSAVTLVAERKICPRCGGRMSLVAAGWYCKKDDYLIHPIANDLVQMIESRRSQETSKTNR